MLDSLWVYSTDPQKVEEKNYYNLQVTTEQDHSLLLLGVAYLLQLIDFSYVANGQD